MNVFLLFLAAKESGECVVSQSERYQGRTFECCHFVVFPLKRTVLPIAPRNLTALDGVFDLSVEHVS